MKIAFLLLTASLLSAESAIAPSPFVEEGPLQPRPSPVAPPSTSNNSFSYLSIGAAVPIALGEPKALLFAMPDIFFGNRHFFSPRHAIDYGIGADVHLYMQMVYGQCSYLYHFKPQHGFYIGLGLTLGAFHLSEKSWLFPQLGPWANIPFTIGYQLPSKKENHRFFQVQVTPLRTATFSYGFGF